jgi:hypothetical protein
MSTQHAGYRIVVRGAGPQSSTALHSCRLGRRSGHTVISGDFPDSTALFDLLGELRHGGHELVSVLPFEAA